MIGHEQLKALASSVFPNVCEVRRHMHKHPELSFKEHETQAFLRSRLQALGVEPITIGTTGLYVDLKGNGPGDRVIALRADIDALPIREANNTEYTSVNEGVMHACGHDAHSACLMGAIEILLQTNNEWGGTVRCIFQPGEEKLPGGASMLIQEGVLENPKPELIIGQHVYPDLPAGKLGFRPGKYMASADEVYITVHGKGGHAALPHKLNDPVLAAAHIITALQQVVSRNATPDIPAVLSIGSVHANGATNVIPDKVELQGTFRTFDETMRFALHRKIQRVAEHTAQAHGCSAPVDIHVGYPYLENDPDATANSIDFATQLLGAENIIPLDLRMTAEDFAYYSQQIPACFYRFGTGKEGSTGLHTATFDIDEDALLTGTMMLAGLALKALDQ